MTVDIVLACYNGEKFLNEQLSSIFEQSIQDFRLIIGDDASSDNTIPIIESWVQRYPDRIVLFPFKKNVGPCANFGRLLEEADAEYVMLCDQDDIWLKDKVRLSLEKMKELEKEYGNDTPLMVYSDLEVIDNKGNSICHSWEKMVGVKKKSFHLNPLLCRHAYLGCTLMINRELLNLATPIPPEAGMHDYWLTLVATAFGKIGRVDSPLIRYRLHEKNVVGAKRFHARWFFTQWRNNPDFLQHEQQRILRAFAKAFVFYQRYRNLLTPEQEEVLQDFTRLKYLSFYKEVGLRWKRGFWEQTFWQNLALLWASRKMGKFG